MNKNERTPNGHGACTRRKQKSDMHGYSRALLLKLPPEVFVGKFACP